jgi:hypothetical protein
MRLSILASSVLLTTMLFGQTISPLAVEYGKKASGEFTITNTSLRPVAVIIEPMDFTAGKDSRVRTSPLSPDVHIKLSEKSAKLGPQQEHKFFYDATCPANHCAFMLSVKVMPVQHVTDGVGVAVTMGTAVYICPKLKSCRVNFLQEWGYVPPAPPTNVTAAVNAVNK